MATATLTLDSLLSGQSDNDTDPKMTPFDKPAPCLVEKGRKGRKKEGEENGDATTKRFGTAHGYRSDKRGVYIMVYYPNGEQIFEAVHYVKMSNQEAHPVKTR